MEEKKYILQHIQGFTVAVLDKEYKIQGTGFIVSTTGHEIQILTAAHVIQGTLLKNKSIAVGDSVLIQIPYAESQEASIQEAFVSCFLQDSDDDVLLLKSYRDPRPFEFQTFARLGNAEGSKNNRFISYGYPRGLTYPEGISEGTIIDIIENPGQGKYLAKLAKVITEKSSMRILQGMSGAAVLDKKRNLVVGMIINYKTKHLPSSYPAHALNCKIITFLKSNLLLETANVELLSKKENYKNWEYSTILIREYPGKAFFGAPIVPSHWTGRRDLLSNLNQIWNGSKSSVVGLIGFGGEGKSCLASYWVNDIDSASDSKKPNGFFWWNFYDNRSIDEFVDALVKFLFEGSDEIKKLSTYMKVYGIANQFLKNKYLCVLDGFEVMLYQAGYRYGRIESDILRMLIQLIAGNEGSSLCIITSRIKIFDLLNYASYHQINVSRLSNDDGRNLLINIGLTAANSVLNRLVQYWDGHALSLTLLGNYLAETKTTIGFDKENRPESQGEDRYRKIHRILYRYDQFLTLEERSFMQLISTFRSSISKLELEEVFRKPGLVQTNYLSKLSKEKFYLMTEKLINRGLVRYTSYNQNRKQPSNRMTDLEIHPLIRQYYSDQLSVQKSRSINLHLAKYVHQRYKPRKRVTLETLRPLIDEVYYLCNGYLFDEAYKIYDQFIDHSQKSDEEDEIENGILGYCLGAFETEFNMLQHFFPDGDISKDPPLKIKKDIVNLLISVGFDLQYLGEPQESISINRRAFEKAIPLEEWKSAAWANQNMAESYGVIGDLKNMMKTCKEGISVANKCENNLEETSSVFVRMGWAHFLKGEILRAKNAFQKADSFQPEDDEDPIPWSWSYGEGVWYSTFLTRTGQFIRANQVTRANMNFSRKNRQLDSIIGCFRVLGDLYRFKGRKHEAITMYKKSLKLATSSGMVEEIVHNYLGKGLIYSELGQYEDAQSDLKQALYTANNYHFNLLSLDSINAMASLTLKKTSINKTEFEKLSNDIDRVIKISSANGYLWARCAAYHNMGELKLRQDNSQSAIKFLKRAKEIRERIHDPRINKTNELLNQVL